MSSKEEVVRRLRADGNTDEIIEIILNTKTSLLGHLSPYDYVAYMMRKNVKESDAWNDVLSLERKIRG